MGEKRDGKGGERTEQKMGKLSHGAFFACTCAVLIILIGPWSLMVQSRASYADLPFQDTTGIPLYERGGELVGDRYRRHHRHPPHRRRHWPPPSPYSDPPRSPVASDSSQST